MLVGATKNNNTEGKKPDGRGFDPIKRGCSAVGGWGEGREEGRMGESAISKLLQ